MPNTYAMPARPDLTGSGPVLLVPPFAAALQAALAALQAEGGDGFATTLQARGYPCALLVLALSPVRSTFRPTFQSTFRSA